MRLEILNIFKDIVIFLFDNSKNYMYVTQFQPLHKDV